MVRDLRLMKLHDHKEMQHAIDGKKRKKMTDTFVYEERISVLHRDTIWSRILGQLDNVLMKLLSDLLQVPNKMIMLQAISSEQPEEQIFLIPKSKFTHSLIVNDVIKQHLFNMSLCFPLKRNEKTVV